MLQKIVTVLGQIYLAIKYASKFILDYQQVGTASVVFSSTADVDRVSFIELRQANTANRNFDKKWEHIKKRSIYAPLQVCDVAGQWTI